MHCVQPRLVQRRCSIYMVWLPVGARSPGPGRGMGGECSVILGKAFMVKAVV